MYKAILNLAALIAAVAASSVPAGAQPRRGHFVVGNVGSGHGFAQWRSAWRQPGSATVSRGLQTRDGRGYRQTRSRVHGPDYASSDRSTQLNDGRGAATTRQADWGDGSFAGSRTTTLNNGTSFGRVTSATGNGDGSASYATTVTGPYGGTRVSSGTLPRRP